MSIYLKKSGLIFALSTGLTASAQTLNPISINPSDNFVAKLSSNQLKFVPTERGFFIEPELLKITYQSLLAQVKKSDDSLISKALTRLGITNDMLSAYFVHRNLVTADFMLSKSIRKVQPDAFLKLYSSTIMFRKDTGRIAFDTNFVNLCASLGIKDTKLMFTQLSNYLKVLDTNYLASIKIFDMFFRELADSTFTRSEEDLEVFSSYALSDTLLSSAAGYADPNTMLYINCMDEDLAKVDEDIPYAIARTAEAMPIKTTPVTQDNFFAETLDESFASDKDKINFTKEVPKSDSGTSPKKENEPDPTSEFKPSTLKTWMSFWRSRVFTE